MRQLGSNFFNIDKYFNEDIFSSVFNRNATFPKMEIFESESHMIAKADLPGMAKEDISIDFKDSILTISGERKIGEVDPNVKFHRTEITYGTFERSFHLGYDIDIENIEASFVDGVLTVNIPKATPDQGKTTIEIR